MARKATLTNQLSILEDDGTDPFILDITTPYAGPGNAYVNIWIETLRKRPDLLTIESRRKIAMNILNGLPMFSGCGRIPEQARREYRNTHLVD